MDGYLGNGPNFDTAIASYALAYADQVQQLDTTGIAPTAHVVPEHAFDRPDTVTPSLDVREALANAPDPSPETGLFKVPRVIG